MANNLPVDMELKKAFQEMQMKMILTTQQLKVSDAQIETLKRNIQHSKLVDKELSGIPEQTKVYEGIGRMFVLAPISDARITLDKKIKAAEEKIKTIESTKAYLERSIKESETSLRDLVLSKQQSRQ
ncbi:hypothetical protein ACJMK2_034864 [Sinanodonta woodiana]|uniref:Prefoldin subunit 1 n=1 Tax=Sinanodonta woodiana TaxID=1069815 RepID=A0ABD3WT40_SINWO